MTAHERRKLALPTTSVHFVMTASILKLAPRTEWGKRTQVKSGVLRLESPPKTASLVDLFQELPLIEHIKQMDGDEKLGAHKLPS